MESEIDTIERQIEAKGRH
jgi:hypothetical protein